MNKKISKDMNKAGKQDQCGAQKISDLIKDALAGAPVQQNKGAKPLDLA